VHSISQRARVTYAIVAHSREQQLLRLVRALRDESPESSVVIHWDKHAEPLSGELLELDNVHLVTDPVHPEWGDFGMVAAVLRCMRTAVARTRFDWFVLLSGQDYPIAPLEQVERDLAAAGCDALIDARRVASGAIAFRWQRSEATRLGRRYFFRYRPLPRLRLRLPALLRSAILRLVFVIDGCQPFVSLWQMPPGASWRLGTRSLRAPFGRDRPCRVGSSWFNITHRGVIRVLDRVDEQQSFVRHYRRTVNSDESFFQTLICADPELQVRPDTSRYQVWETDGWPLHPNILTVDHAQALLGSGKHFARKLDEGIDRQVFDLIDAHRRNGGLAASYPTK
jgi:hypothetical protein